MMGQCMDNVAICMESEEWEVRQEKDPMISEMNSATMGSLLGLKLL